MLVALWTPRHRVRPSARPTGSKRLRKARQGFFVPGCPLLSVGTCGVGLNLGMIISTYKHSNPDWLVGDIVLGTMLLALAVKGSFRVLNERK